MTKQDYINYWKESAQKDWMAASHLFEKSDYLHCLFFAHLVLEKFLKAHVVKDNKADFPPKTHNLLVLISQTKLSPSIDQLRLLSQVNQFQLDGRYPDYQMIIYKTATQVYTQSLLNEIEQLKTWLENHLP